MNDRDRPGARRAVVLVALATAVGLGTSAALAAAASTPAARAPHPGPDGQLAQAYVGWMTRVFAVPAGADVDAPLREAMSRLVDEHLARLRRLLPAWIAEERRRAQAPLPPGALERAIHNRLVNELALWRLESPGADYDAVLTRAILKPGVCDRPPRDGYLGLLMSWFQAVPATDRPALLAGERTLLARWGTRRAGLAPRPAKSLSEDESDAIVRLRSGADAPDVPMPPVLANSAFKGEALSSMRDVDCALHQWGLARRLRHGDAPAAALAAWRYATMRTAADWNVVPDADAASRDPGGYPPVARAWAVTGSIDLRVQPDAQGRFASASIAGRNLAVPGVTDNPPVAFETLLDAASLATAPLRFKAVAPPADGSPPPPVAMRIVWRLE